MSENPLVLTNLTELESWRDVTAALEEIAETSPNTLVYLEPKQSSYNEYWFWPKRPKEVDTMQRESNSWIKAKQIIQYGKMRVTKVKEFEDEQELLEFINTNGLDETFGTQGFYEQPQ